MSNNKFICVISIIIIIILFTQLMKKIYIDKKNIKENFFDIVKDVDELKENVNTINFEQDVSQGRIRHR